ncbi:MAG: hypothetical protein RL095_1998 [Verrucomicrobiota bacterium]|jgi:hypothetical protein
MWMSLISIAIIAGGFFLRKSCPVQGKRCLAIGLFSALLIPLFSVLDGEPAPLFEQEKRLTIQADQHLATLLSRKLGKTQIKISLICPSNESSPRWISICAALGCPNPQILVPNSLASGQSLKARDLETCLQKSEGSELILVCCGLPCDDEELEIPARGHQIVFLGVDNPDKVQDLIEKELISVVAPRQGVASGGTFASPEEAFNHRYQILGPLHP